MSQRISNNSAFLVSLNVPDKTGKMADVVLGFHDRLRRLYPQRIHLWRGESTASPTASAARNSPWTARLPPERQMPGPTIFVAGPFGFSSHVHRSATPLDGPRHHRPYDPTT